MRKKKPASLQSVEMSPQQFTEKALQMIEMTGMQEALARDRKAPNFRALIGMIGQVKYNTHVEIIKNGIQIALRTKNGINHRLLLKWTKADKKGNRQVTVDQIDVKGPLGCDYNRFLGVFDWPRGVLHEEK